MIPFLAQLSSIGPTELGVWLMGAGGAMALLNQGAAFVDRFRSHPPAHEVYATKEELEELKERVDAIGEKIEANYNKIMEKSAESRARMYSKIDDISGVVRRIEGKLDL